MKLKFPLKMKLTAISVLILTAMCVIFAASTISSGNTLSQNMLMSPESLSARDSVPAAEVVPAVEANPSTEAIPAAATTEAFDQFYGTTILAMVCLIAVGSVLTYLLAAKTLKPLENLTEKISKITINSLDETIPVPHTGDEVEQLTQSFNDMAAKINQSYQAQKNFSANAAHELRTPLAMLQTQIEVFQMKPDRTASEYTALLQSIGESTDRLSHLVNDLLSFTNEQEIDRTQLVDLRSLLEETAFELEEAASAKHVTITVSGEGTIYGNDSLLQRAFYNLISNAIRYNVDEGRVDIQIAQGEVTISDTGIGIPDEAKPNVFTTFFCVDKSRSRELGGCGLGLAIAKNIIERHDGTIRVRDNQPQGTVFTIAFNETEPQ